MKKEIIIYGMGNMGIDFYFFSKCYDVKVLAFADRDKNKVGNYIGNTVCISYEELLEKYKGTQIVVAIFESGALESEFRKAGFKCVLGWREAKRELAESASVIAKCASVSEICEMKEELQQGLKDINFIIKNDGVREVVTDYWRRR